MLRLTTKAVNVHGEKACVHVLTGIEIFVLEINQRVFAVSLKLAVFVDTTVLIHFAQSTWLIGVRLR